MKTSLDCIPCFVRQTLEAARFTTADASTHERLLRNVLRVVADLDLAQSPPAVAQIIHRRLRAMTGVRDPYAAAKARSTGLRWNSCRSWSGVLQPRRTAWRLPCDWPWRAM